MRQIYFVLLGLFVYGAAHAATCDINQYLNNGVCSNCIYNATCDGDTYKCTDGFYDTGANECASCPINSTCTSPAEFECVSGTYLADGVCSVCPLNATCDGQVFKCNDGFYRYGNSCLSCKGHICDGDRIVSCGENYYLYDISVDYGQYCVKCYDYMYCPAGSTRASYKCIEGYYKADGCIKCPEQNFCPFAESDKDNYLQYCASGYYKAGNKCEKCPDGVECPGGKPENMSCSAGLYLHKNGQCLPYDENDSGVPPDCHDGYYDNGANCVACVENSTCTSQTDFTCKLGYYKNGQVCSLCPANSACVYGAENIMCDAGYWLSGDSCKKCPAFHYCNDNTVYNCPEYVDGSLDSVLPDGYKVIAVEGPVWVWSYSGLITKNTDCYIKDRIIISGPDGVYALPHAFYDGEKYIQTKIVWMSANTGRYLSSYFMMYGVGYYEYNKACTNAPAHATYTGAGSPDGNDCPWKCDDGYMRDGDTCTTCPAGYTCINGLIACPSGQYASNKQCLPCPEFYDGRSADNIAPQSVNQCQIKCDGGAYLANAKDTHCANVGAGYWAAENYTNYGDAGVRNECPDNLTTIGYGIGADSAEDCGKILHIGGYTLYLRSGKLTSPSLAVQYGNRILYGDMAREKRGHLRTEYNGAVYSIFNTDID